MKLPRRSVLAGALAGVTSSLASRAAVRPGDDRAARLNFVILFLPGGMDAVFTTDPKERKEVEPWVDVPTTPDQHFAVGGAVFGPHLKPLERWLDKLVVINGVKTYTANHISGAVQVGRLRTRAHKRMPMILDLIGERRPGQPLSSVTLGFPDYYLQGPQFFGGNQVPSDRYADAKRGRQLFNELDRLSPEDYRVLAEAFPAQAPALGWGSELTQLNSNRNVAAVKALYRRLQDTPPFKTENWKSPFVHSALAMERALWLLEHGISRSVFVAFNDVLWDSHITNTRMQEAATPGGMELIARFFDELAKRKGPHGPLLDNTVVVMGSELGRYPQLNSMDGKDHFPEAPYLLYVPRVTPAVPQRVFGKSNRRMEATPIRLVRNRVAYTDHIVLDDLGGTLLALAGIRPDLYGYPQPRLPFLSEVL